MEVGVLTNPALGPIQLRTVGEQSWDVDREALLDELRQLAGMGDVHGEDQESVSQAIELVEYEIGNGTGVAVVPPSVSPGAPE